MPHTLPWLLEESLSHSREVETVLILTLQRKPSPLTSSCPKQCWCGSRVMKGLLHSFDPGASWVTLALPGLRNAGPHWLCFLFPLIFTASSGSCAYSVLAKENSQELRTRSQKRREVCIQRYSVDCFHQWESSDVAQCFSILTFPFCFCSSQWFVIWVSCISVISIESYEVSFRKACRQTGKCVNVISKGSQAPWHNQLLVSLVGLGAEQAYGFKLRTYLFLRFFFLFWLGPFSKTLLSLLHHCFFSVMLWFMALRHVGS